MYKLNGLIAVSLFGLTACGGGSGGSSTVVNDGVFKDSNVFGLMYESGSQKGVTDEDGAFKYEEGTDVNFSVGGVDLGSGEGKSVMTPIDLVDGGTLGNAEVINKVRFLMMLDKDNAPSNGIEISAEVQAKAEDWDAVDFTAADFPFNEVLSGISNDASAADGESHSFPSAEDATAHLQSTLLCASAGAFKGSYSGSEGGTVVFVVDPVTGEVNGSSYNPYNEVSVEVNNTEAIDYDSGLTFVSAENSAKEFSGLLESTEAISGSWVNKVDETQSGNFSADRFGSSNSAVERYATVYTGTGDNQGIFTFDVDKNGKVTGKSYTINTGLESELTGTLEDNILTVTAEDGTEIDGLLNEDGDLATLDLKGLWRNFEDFEQGEFTGSGCLLN